MKHAMRFNLIEILLTVAVIAFGVAVILGMLPRGLALTRSAGMESYASEIIDQMAGYMFEIGTGNLSEYTEANEANYIDYMKGSGDDTPTDLDKSIMKGYLQLIGSSADTGAVATSESSDKVGEQDSCKFYRTGTAGVFKVDAGSGNTKKGIYVIIMGDYNNRTGSDKESRIDFSGMLRCWKRPLKVRALRQKTRPPTVDGTGAEAGWAENSTKRDEFEAAEITLKDGAVLCMELSYPLTLPYNQRTKRYYTFEVPK